MRQGSHSVRMSCPDCGGMNINPLVDHAIEGVRSRIRTRQKFEGSARGEQKLQVAHAHSFASGGMFTTFCNALALALRSCELDKCCFCLSLAAIEKRKPFSTNKSQYHPLHRIGSGRMDECSGQSSDATARQRSRQFYLAISAD